METPFPAKLLVSDGVGAQLKKGTVQIFTRSKTIAGREYYGCPSSKRKCIIWFRDYEVKLKG